MFGGDPGKIAADLWYEQARTGLGAVVRKETRLETIQALVFLALRDHGRGNESQAWLLIGTAIRMGQELDLHMPPPSKSRLSPEEIQVRQSVWGVCLLLDLLLSLQLGKPPAVADSLRSPPVLPSPQSQSLFAHTYNLCHIVSRINLHLYFGFTPSAPTALATLKQELDSWQQTLPMQFRISLGHQPEQKVLEINMFYHVAVILLYRPFYKDKSNVGVFLDAASTFNMLLEKYRNADASPSSLAVSSPSMIYLIFTTAIAHLSGYKYKEKAESHSTTAALQTQLHLLHCLEALKTIGVLGSLRGAVGGRWTG
ncbi:hypothetical protein BDZ89DRAFT_1128393 [Hymenopellis radicata]|nr:hypothetical protein BDZ89DRAFT_1128393 [Hymenopellis radicata]